MKRFVCSGVVCGTTVLGALAIPLAVGQSPPGPGGAKVEAAKEQGRKEVEEVGPWVPRGLLGNKLGTYLTIEGVRDESGFKVGIRTLLVDTVGGKKLDKPVAVWVNNLDLPAKQRCVLKRYETGMMIGTPPAVLEATAFRY